MIISGRKCTKTELKKSNIWPIWGQSEPPLTSLHYWLTCDVSTWRHYHTRDVTVSWPTDLHTTSLHMMSQIAVTLEGDKNSGRSYSALSMESWRVLIKVKTRCCCQKCNGIFFLINKSCDFFWDLNQGPLDSNTCSLPTEIQLLIKS